MPRDLKIDRNTTDHGPVFDPDTGDFVWVEDEEEMLQHVETQLLTAQGTHSSDPSFGLKYRGDSTNPGIIGKVSVGTAGAIVRAALESRPDVLEVLSFVPSLNNQTRRLSISFTLKTTAGLVSRTLEI